MVKERDINTKLMGLSVEQVDEYLAALQKEHMDKIVELKYQIELHYKEKEALRQKLIDLELDQERLGKSKDIMQLALKRARDSISFIQAKANDELDEILFDAEKRSRDYEGKLSIVHNEIAQTRSDLRVILNNLNGLIGADIKRYEDKRNESLPSKVVGKIFPSNSNMRAKEYTNTWKKILLPNGSTISEDKPLNDVNKNDGSNDENDKRMTADGTIAPEIMIEDYVVPEKKEAEPAQIKEPHEEILDTEEKEKYKEIVENITETLNRTMPAENQPKHERNVMNDKYDGVNEQNEIKDLNNMYTSGGFWDDNVDNSIFSIAAIGQMEKEIAPSKEYINNGNKQDNNIIGKINVPVSKELEQKTAKCTESVDSVDSVDSVESPAITKEINRIRHKYIINKIAGEDLYDKDGNLIVAKKEVITDVVVDKAEEAGKLAELIVNMQLPGMDE